MPSPLDHQLFLFLNADRGWKGLDLFMAVMSSFDFWLPLFILAGLLVAWRGGFRARAMLICLLLCVAVIESALVNPLKDVIGRPRPLNVLPDARSVALMPTTPRLLAVAQPARIKPAKVQSPLKPGRSMPSGHTANMFCLATVLAAFYGWRGAIFFFPAALVGLSRVATGSHWPTDVLISAGFSILITLALLSLFGRIWQKFGPRIAPKLAAGHPRLSALA